MIINFQEQVEGCLRKMEEEQWEMGEAYIYPEIEEEEEEPVMTPYGVFGPREEEEWEEHRAPHFDVYEWEEE